jgi:predicted enzyme related to lactoylglutathione lyase
MGERTSHTPGTFSWTDLATTDPAAAKDFYTSLLGWDAEDLPIPEGGVYTMLLRNGRRAAALNQGQEGQPPAWNSYVTVAGADAAAAAAEENGGTLAAEPFDVMEAGRMAVIQDPTGAFFSVWEPRENIGAEVVNEPGALTLNQLTTSDPERAQEFYAGVFGWRFESMEGGDDPYWGIYHGDRVNGGMMPLPPDQGMPSHWLVYFGSESVDDDAGRVTDLGGTIVLSPMEVPGGKILVAQDPQGATFALFSGRFDD